MSRKMNFAIVVFGLMLCAGRPAQADIPAPRLRPAEQNQEVVPIVIKIDAEARNVRLQIPESFLDGEPNASTSTPSGRTLFAGLAMSIAIGCVFFVNRGNRVVRGVVVTTLGLAAIFAVSGSLQADIAAPYRNGRIDRSRRNARPQVERRTEVLLPAGVQVGTNAICEVVPEGDHLTLILPSRLQSDAKVEHASPARPAPAPAAPNASDSRFPSSQSSEDPMELFGPAPEAPAAPAPRF